MSQTPPPYAVDQPVGEPTGWRPGPRLGPVVLEGRHCRLEPLALAHAPELYAALCRDAPDATWTYLAVGPFESLPEFTAYVGGVVDRPDLVPLAVLVDDTALGIAAWLRVDHANGTAEVGHITLAPALRRTTAATEAMHLMARHAFDTVGVRRYEWKCDSLNAPSRLAAERLGFRFEGVFRQAVVYKGRNRDTAWFAMTDRDWPAVRAAHERWLDPANFDHLGRQRVPLTLQETP